MLGMKMVEIFQAAFKLHKIGMSKSDSSSAFAEAKFSNLVKIHDRRECAC